MPDIRLAPGQKAALRGAIENAFDPDTLDLMVSDHLGKRLHHFAKEAKFDIRIHLLIESVSGYGWLRQLIRGVMVTRPDHPDVIAFVRDLGLHPVTQAKAELQAFVGPNRTFHDANQFFERGYLTGTRVCQVRRNGDALGTAVLVGPDAILTNWHVMRFADKAPKGAAAYELVFGFARTNAGDVIDDGETFRAADDWHIASAPTGDTTAPAPDDLDFALVKLAERAGDLPVARAKNGPARKWIALSEDKPDFARTGLAILEHPVLEGQARHPLKLALDTAGQATEVLAGHRVRYGAPTLKGSSGSPVFDLETWTLVALHHLGVKGQYNQGIPTWLIARHPEVKAYLAAC